MHAFVVVLSQMMPGLWARIRLFVADLMASPFLLRELGNLNFSDSKLLPPTGVFSRMYWMTVFMGRRDNLFSLFLHVTYNLIDVFRGPGY